MDRREGRMEARTNEAAAAAVGGGASERASERAGVVDETGVGKRDEK